MSETTTITVNVKWQQNPGSPLHPLRNVAYSLLIYNLVPHMAVGFLDYNGSFKTEVPKTIFEWFERFPNKTQVHLSLISATTDCEVVYRKNGRDKSNTVSLTGNLDLKNKSIDFSFYLNPVEGKDYPADSETCDRRRLVVASILQFGPTYIREVMGMTPCKTKCYYPKSAKAVKNSYCLLNIHLFTDHYLSAHTILHEFGHDFYGTFKAYNRIPYSDHNDNMDMSVNYSKSRGMYTAFIEGFATYFANRVGVRYGEYLKDFSDYNLFTINPNYSKCEVCGEACEGSISSLFYDMTDSYSENDYCYNSEGNIYGFLLDPIENLSMKDKDIVNIIKDINPQNIYSFTKAFYKKHTELEEHFNNLLSMQGIAPSNVYFTKNDGKVVEFKWKPGGTLKSPYFDGDDWITEGKECKTYQKEFDISLYDAEYNLLKMFHVKDKETYSFKYNLIERFGKNYNYCLMKIKGYSYQRCNTEYQSSYFRIDLRSYATNKRLTLLPSFINELTGGKEWKDVMVDSVSVTARRDGLRIEEKGNLIMAGKDSYLTLKFEPASYTDVSIEFAAKPHRILEAIMMDVTFQNGTKKTMRLTESVEVNYHTFKMKNFSYITGIELRSEKANVQKGKIKRIILSDTQLIPHKFGGTPEDFSGQIKPNGNNLDRRKPEVLNKKFK